MQDITVKHAVTGAVLYTGCFSSLRACLESAAVQSACLSGADLRYANLVNAELDGIILKGARLDHANLSGANLSEAHLEGSVLANASLQNACLCFADLTACDFTSCQFGATDITGARLDKSRFSTLSAFTLNFRDTASMDACLFAGDTVMCPFSKPPLVLTGLAHTIALLDDHIQVGLATLPLQLIPSLGSSIGDLPSLPMKGQGIHAFLASVRIPLHELLRYRRAGSFFPERATA